MKALLIIIDGLADRPSKLLGGKTPLMAAHTPNLDALSARSINGLMDPLSPGLALGSETAHYLLFGYSEADFPGRALLEAVGEEIAVADEEVAVITSFGSILPDAGALRVVERYMPHEARDADRIAEVVPPAEIRGVSFRFHYLRKSGGLLILRGPVSPDVTDCDPFVVGMPVIKVVPMAESKEPERAEATAAAINSYLSMVHHRLTDHPVNRERLARGAVPINFLFTKWASRRKKIMPFQLRYGMKGASIATPSFYQGIAIEMGMEPIAVKALDDPEEDMRSRIAIAESLFDRGTDFIHLHIKAADDAAHKKDPALKRDVVEMLDRGCDTLLAGLSAREDMVTIVAADHATPSEGPLIHSGEAVPLVIVGKNVLPDDVTEFNEKAAVKGGLGRIRAMDLMNIVVNLTDRANRHELRPTPHRVFYIPTRVRPFALE